MPEKSKLMSCTHKTCPCKNPQPIEQFGIRKNTRKGFQSWCKTCMSLNGCMNAKKNPERMRQNRRKSYANNRDSCLSASRKFHHSLEGKFSIAKSGAKKRKLDWNISFEEFAEYNSRPCFYCGGSLPPAGGGLDRVDNSQGYLNTNVVSCCELCNKMKRDLDLTEFIQHIHKIHKLHWVEEEPRN